MTTLVLGATGATGRLLVRQLLDRGERVRAVVRTADRLPEEISKHDGLSLVEGNVLELSDSEIHTCLEGCTAVVSCLGHNLSLKGLFGPPRRLVTDSIRRVCTAIQSTPGTGPTKVLLMNTAGNGNRDLDEPISTAQSVVLGLLRLLLPPHVDNEKAADFLRVQIGQNHRAVEWTAVRPDNLTNDPSVSPYSVHESPTRSAIFDPGITSRINVAHFMAELVTDEETWSLWRGKMPVIYNKTDKSGVTGSQPAD